MESSTAAALIQSANNSNEWHQQLFIIHNDKWLDITSAALGKSSTTPIGAPDQPTKYPYGSVYRLDTKFKGMDKKEDVIRMLRLLEVHPGCAVTIRTTDTKYTSTRLGTWTLSCSQYRKPPKHQAADKEFKDDNYAQTKVNLPTTKRTKTEGTTNKGIVHMLSKTKRKHAASLFEEHPICPVDHHHIGDDAKPKVKRCTSSKFGDGSCQMKIIVFCNMKDEYFYISTSSSIVHSTHAKLPLKAIPRNGDLLTEKELELVNNLFKCRLKRSEVANVLETQLGKENTTIDPMTLYNIRRKSQNLLDKKSGYTGDLTDPSKTLKKLKE